MMSCHKNTLKTHFASIQPKSYSVLNLGDNTPLYCCFGCKSATLSMTVAAKHVNPTCGVAHEDFLDSLNTQSASERLEEALKTIERLKKQVCEFRDAAISANSSLQLYDQMKTQARESELHKQKAIEKYIEEFQRVLKPVFYHDLSGVKLLNHFKSADQNAKKVFEKDGTHRPYSTVMANMEQIVEDSPYLQASLFPSYQLYMSQYLQSGTNSYINGSTWLDDEYRHYKIRFPDYETYVYKNKSSKPEPEPESESESESEPEPPKKEPLPIIPERRPSFKAFSDEPPKILTTTRRPSLKS
jgi:hypothetical protein